MTTAEGKVIQEATNDDSFPSGHFPHGARGGDGGTLLAGKAAGQEVTLWSHWADHESKVAFVEEAARRFEAANPGVEVKISQVPEAAARGRLEGGAAGRPGAGLFYAEPAQTEYVDNGFLHPLDELIDWDTIEDWARGSLDP